MGNGGYRLAMLSSLVLTAAARAGSPGLTISPSFGSTENTGSSALVTMNFSESRFGDLLTITLQNTTPPEIGSRLTAVGIELPDFLVDRPALVKAELDDYFDVVTYDVRVSPGWQNADGGYDLVLSGDGNFLGGNPQGAPESGEFARILLTLGDTGMTPEQLTAEFQQFYFGAHQPFVIGRFQSVGLNGEDSDKVLGGIPEPATLMLLATGGLILLRRRIR